MPSQSFKRTLDMMTSTSYLGSVWARQQHGDVVGQVVWALDALTRYLKQYTPKALYRRFKRWLTELDYTQIDDVELDGIHTWDAPDFCDAYVCAATYKGRDMTETELDRLNEDRDFVYAAVQDRLY